jgi:hypothetical protein
MPADCTRILIDNGIRVKFVYETENSPFSHLRTLCQRNNVPFGRPSPPDLTNLLDHIESPMVIFSINNNYIFPQKIIAKKNMRIINFHNSLLPAYPGHGAIIPTWVIYNGEKQHGVTWHLVDERLDAGRILCYDVFDVLKSDTALSLMMRSVLRGINLFAREWNSLVDFDYLGVPQEDQHQDIYEHPSRFRMRRKRDLPNGGYLDMSWELGECVRFLRSMDYGPLGLLPPAKIKISSDVYLIKKYRVNELTDVERPQGSAEVVLSFAAGTITLGVEKEIGSGKDH